MGQGGVFLAWISQHQTHVVHKTQRALWGHHTSAFLVEENSPFSCVQVLQGASQNMLHFICPPLSPGYLIRLADVYSVRTFCSVCVSPTGT